MKHRLLASAIVVVVLLTPTVGAVSTINSTRVITTDLTTAGRTSLGLSSLPTDDALHVEGTSLFNGTIWANASFGQANFLRVGNWTTSTHGNLTNTTLTANRTWTLPDLTGTLALANSADNIQWASVSKSGSSLADLATRSISDTTGTLATTRGGTGLTTYAQGDLPYASAADTLARLTIGTTGTVLSSTGTAPAWSTIESLGGVTGTGAANRVSYWSDADTITSDADLLFDGTSLIVPGTTVTATKALVLGPTNSAMLPSAVEGALVYDTTNDVFKGGISSTPSYRTFGMLEKANTWTATQTFASDIVANANVAIGTSSPLSPLDVFSPTGGRASVRYAGTTVDAFPEFEIWRSRGTDTLPSAVSSGDSIGRLTFLPYTDAWHGDWAYIQGAMSTATSTELRFFTNNGGVAGVQRLLIDNNGDLTVADTGDFILSTGTGTKFGTATGQKMGWWDATPVARSTWTLTGADLTDNSSGISGGNTIAAIVTGPAACSNCATAASTANAIATIASATDENTADIAAIKTILSTYGLVG